MSAQISQIYTLDIRVPGHGSNTISIIKRVTIGSKDQNDICITEFNLLPVHCIFNCINEVLSVQSLSKDGGVKVNKNELKKGKMYIVDKGDKIKLNDEIDIIIVRDKIKNDDQLEELIASNTLDIEDKSLIGIDQSELKASNEENNEEIDLKEDSNNSTLEPTREIKLNNKETSKSNVLNKKEKTSVSSLIDSAAPEKNEVTLKLSLLGRIKGKFTKNKLEIEKEKVQKPKKLSSGTGSHSKAINSDQLKLSSSKNATYPVGVIARVLAFSMEIGLTYFIVNEYKYHLKIPQFSSIINQISIGVNKFLVIANKSLSTIPEVSKYLVYQEKVFNIQNYEYLFCFALLTIFSHIIFSTSLPMFLFGATEIGSFISKRIKGFFKCLFFFILLPLAPITYISTILSKRSLPEVLSGYYVGYRAKSCKVLPLLISAIALLSYILLPTIINLKNQTNVAQTNIIENKKIPDFFDNNNYKFTQDSYDLGLRFKQVLRRGTYIYPSLDNRKFTVNYYDKKYKETIKLTQLNSIKLVNLVSKAQKKNPVFPYLYKHIDNFYNSPDKKGKITIDVENQFNALLESSLNLSLENLHNVILKNGPFLQSLGEIKKDLQQKLKVKPDQALTIFKGKYKTFFIYNLDSDPLVLYLNKDKINVYLLKGKNIKMKKDFIKNFLINGRALSNKKLESIKRWNQFVYFETKKIRKKKFNKFYTKYFIEDMAHWSLSLIETGNSSLHNSNYKLIKKGVKNLDKIKNSGSVKKDAKKILNYLNQKKSASLQSYL